MKKTVSLGSVILGEGMPKVCVPVMGADIEAIADAAARAAQAKADLIELRMDSLSVSPGCGEAIDACRRARACGLPVIFTLRTQRDGGPGTADAAAYEALLCAVARSGACEAIDCELSVGEEAFERIAAAAHGAGIAVVGSSHEFGRIGDMNRAAEWLARQAALGADICKAAVMTHSAAEAMEAMRVMTCAGGRLDRPMIAIAMGPAGVLTRIGAQCMGSCLSFGTAGEASAPGQMDAATLRSVLKIVYDAMK